MLTVISRSLKMNHQNLGSHNPNCLDFNKLNVDSLESDGQCQQLASLWIDSMIVSGGQLVDLDSG